MLADDEITKPTSHPKLRVARVPAAMLDVTADITAWIESLGVALEREELKHLLPEYRPSE